MAAAPSKTTTTKTVNNKTGITKSVSTTTSGGSTTVTKTTTIGAPAKTSSSSSVSTPSKAASTVLADQWITGPNETWPMCGPVAVANSLLQATGTEAPNGDIERLYRAAGAHGDSGAPLEAFLAAAASTGLAGCRLASYRLVPAAQESGVLLLAVRGLTDLHAAAWTGDEVILWGLGVTLADLDAQIINAWSLTWHGEGEVR